MRTVGTGFSVRLQKDLLKKFEALEISKNAFKITPDFNKPSRFRSNPPKSTALWPKPEMLCKISYRELTSYNALRHPSLKDLEKINLQKKFFGEKLFKKKL